MLNWILLYCMESCKHQCNCSTVKTSDLGSMFCLFFISGGLSSLKKSNNYVFCFFLSLLEAIMWNQSSSSHVDMFLSRTLLSKLWIK